MKNVACSLVLLTLLNLLASCVASKAWIVEMSPEGGIIGYQKNDGDDDELHLVISRRAAQICGDRSWQVVRDRLHSKDSSFTTMQPVTSKSESSYEYFPNGNTFGTPTRVDGVETTTSYVPVTYQTTDFWRETQISCSNSSSKGEMKENRSGIQGTSQEDKDAYCIIRNKMVKASNPACADQEIISPSY